MVTKVCLGTMTWGVQNTEAEAHQQLDYAIKERGVNFIDTAEMYPVPSSAPNWKPGTTELYIGTWLEKNADMRSEIVIATKVSGYNESSDVAGNRYSPSKGKIPARLDKQSIFDACDASLRRMKISCIDIYQIHWPDRYAPTFGSTCYDPSRERDTVPLEETITAMSDLIKAGKIKHYALSNETTFGVCEFIRIADKLGCPRPVTIQNSFCLLHRSFETELAEACCPHNYNIPLLPWTPLAGGALSGKYLGGKFPEGARFTKFPAFQDRYRNPACIAATEEYKKIADKAGVSLTTLSLAWCNTRFYVGSTIIGATTMEQLKEDIDAFMPDIELSEETLQAIDDVHIKCRDPCTVL